MVCALPFVGGTPTKKRGGLVVYVPIILVHSGYDWGKLLVRVAIKFIQTRIESPPPFVGVPPTKSRALGIKISNPFYVPTPSGSNH